MNCWASHPLETATSDFLASVRSQSPVALIATLRERLQCKRKNRWQEIEHDRALASFDYVPLTDSDGIHIVAVFVRGTGPVELREDMFMAADAPLISFLKTADHQRFRFLVANSNISGMVTLSDIQKLPTYSVLFGLVIAVEILLMEWIRRKCHPDEDAWLDHLKKRDRKSVERYWKKAQESNMAIDRLAHASLDQEIRAAQSLGLFNDCDEQCERIRALKTLRDNLCHAKEFAPTPEQALTIPSQVRDAETLIQWLETQIGQIAQ